MSKFRLSRKNIVIGVVILTSIIAALFAGKLWLTSQANTAAVEYKSAIKAYDTKFVATDKALVDRTNKNKDSLETYLNNLISIMQKNRDEQPKLKSVPLGAKVSTEYKQTQKDAEYVSGQYEYHYQLASARLEYLKNETEIRKGTAQAKQLGNGLARYEIALISLIPTVAANGDQAMLDKVSKSIASSVDTAEEFKKVIAKIPSPSFFNPEKDRIYAAADVYIARKKQSASTFAKGDFTKFKELETKSGTEDKNDTKNYDDFLKLYNDYLFKMLGDTQTPEYEQLSKKIQSF